MAKKRKIVQKQVEQLLIPTDFPTNLSSIGEDLREKYAFDGEIDRGKTGIAYRLRSSLNGQLYCLKTLLPTIEKAEERARVRETITKEIDILSPLRHRSLPVLYEKNVESESPYYVCTFHPGITFGKFKSSGKFLTLEQSVLVIWSLMDVLKYLHSERRTHCDLHQNNVLISEEVFRDGILVIDFGSGHRDSDSSADTENRGNMYFKDARNKAQYGSTVSRGIDFEGFDFRALGSLLAIMQPSFFKDASSIQVNAYFDFCSSLTDGKLATWQDVHERFLAVIDPRRIVSSTDRLFTSADGQPQIVPLPVNRTVAVGKAPLAVINAPVFQRLRGIHQLSFCEWYFPGATHTRFEHSLGVFETVRQALNGLVHDRVFRDKFTADQVKGTLLAGLLHDVGHYPFAHVVEQYVAGRFPASAEAKNLVSHLKNTLEILETDALRPVIEKEWGVNSYNECINVLENRSTVLSEVIDGPMDCDKIDYLARDSLHCGVPFGQGLDRAGLLHSLCTVQDGTHLGVRSSGISAAEGLIILQDQMLSSVYWHETIRSVISMFHAVLAHLVQTDIEKLRDLVTQLKGCKSDYEALSRVIEPKLKAVRLEGKAKVEDDLKRLIGLHLNPSFNDIYVPIRTYRPTDEIPKRAKNRFNIYNTIVAETIHMGSSIPLQWNFVKELRRAYMDAFSEKQVKIASTQLVIDVPYGKGAHRVVFVRDVETGVESKITEISHLNSTIFEKPAAYLSPIRIYTSPEIMNKCSTKIQSIIQSAEERFLNRESIARSEDWA